MKSLKLYLVFGMILLSLPLFGQTDRSYWIERYLSVSYPLKSIRVNSPFGLRKDPFTGKKSVHSGLDLEANYEDVYSMFDGIVEKTGTDSRSGVFVILRHGAYTVSYCHLSRVHVKEGDLLIAGDKVGVSGNTGRSVGPHLHITCKYKGDVRDPNTLLTYIKEVRSEAILALGGENSRTVESLSKINHTEFFNKYASAAMDQQRRYGIPSSVILAQMAFESNYGQSQLALAGNNFFGIKCSKAWLESGKPYSVHDDDHKNEKFCNYALVDESIEHHSAILMSERYKRCRRYKETDYHNWLVGIKAAGYATAPDYVSKIESIIKRYKLYLFDRMAIKA